MTELNHRTEAVTALEAADAIGMEARNQMILNATYLSAIAHSLVAITQGIDRLANIAERQWN